MFAKCFGALLVLLWVGFTIKATREVFPEKVINKFLVLGLVGGHAMVQAWDSFTMSRMCIILGSFNIIF